MYAEIILPLPLYSTFTYEIPEELETCLKIGSRVLVQFGRKKYYTGIVESTHSQTPNGYDVKPIMGVLDTEPIIKYPQLKHWHWIADYYLCSPGEVYKAAVPTGLKPESETYITLNVDSETIVQDKLSENQQIIIEILKSKKKFKISDIENHFSKFSPNSKTITNEINKLLELGLIEIAEKIEERYTEKKETYVTIPIERGDNESLHKLFDLVGRSQIQEKTLVAWLDLSGWMRKNNELKTVSKEDLIATSNCSQGVLRTMINKGIFNLEKRSINRFNKISANKNQEIAELSSAQKNALSEIHKSFLSTQTTLLHGVTGSGKTEIYNHLIADVLSKKKQVLFLVPEISLTTQLTNRLRKVFGDSMLVYHSKFSDNERVDIWKRLLSTNEPLLILGVRSSVFLPFSNLGLVIIDEEHESSYKQYDPAPRYNARDAAIVLASMHGAKTLLGSATPSIETYSKALSGKYGLVTILERFAGATMPDVKIIDMRKQRKQKEAKGILSAPLLKSTEENLKQHSQSIFFQNRRGFAPIVVCKQCGWTPKCHNCDVSLVYHKNTDLLKCHYCGFSQQLPRLCPACGQNSIETFGYGTERIAEEIHECFPDARISRMDLDTTRNKNSYQEIIEEFSQHDTDILVGTQMISKGLDFGNVRLVGVVNADTLLNFPDFRSNERAFNMLEQVSGRAGRRENKGEVIIQTTRPDHPVLAKVVAHDFLGFYNEEIQTRKEYAYPPFSRIINIYVKNKDATVCARAASILANALMQTFGSRVLGPEKPLVGKIALWFLQQIMLKVESEASIKKVKNLLRQIIAATAHFPEMKSSVIYFDVDPV